jgi:hypothetical protein
MIPGKILRFLDERASTGFAGTRDAALIPRGHRVSAWQVDADGRTLTVFIPASSAPQLIEHLQDNGRIACTFEEVGTHETYQIKGRYLSHRPVRPADVDYANRIRERFAKSLRSFHPDELAATMLAASVSPPVLAVEIEVQEVFLQTPGPGAGARIVPPPNAERSAT